MRRVEDDENWTLFCPADAPTLLSTFGEEFVIEYERLEEAGLGKKVIRARDLWKEIIISQIESGGPFIMFKDAVNGESYSSTALIIPAEESLREEQRAPIRNHISVQPMYRNSPILRRGRDRGL